MNLKIFLFAITLFPIIGFCQLKIQPLAGLSMVNVKIVNGKNYNIRGVNIADILDEGLFVSIGVKERISISSGVLISDVGVGYKFVTDNWGSNRKEYTYKDVFMFPLHLSRASKLIRLLKKDVRVNFSESISSDLVKNNIKSYHLYFLIEPFVGVSYNVLGRSKAQTDEYGYGSTTEGFNSKLFFGNNEEYVVNRSGVSLQTGAKLQFKHYSKDRLSIYFIMNLSLTTYMKTHVLYTLEGQEEQRADFVSKGNFVGLYLSYPITLVNKKGERRKDR